MAAETIVVPSKVQLHRRSRLLVQLGRIAVFARTPTPSVQNAARLAPTLSLRGLKPASDLRVKTGQGFDEWDVLFAGFSGGLFGLSRCAGLAGFGSGWF